MWAHEAMVLLILDIQSIALKSASIVVEKGRLLLTKIKANTVNTCLLCEILKILIGNMLNSTKESPNFYPF